VAILPLSARGRAPDAEYMALLVLLVFFALLGLASALGLTADSRDSADWRPTVGGFRNVL